jgi:hypothetical protein
MKLAKVEMTLSREVHHVFLDNVTPAELLLLVAEHTPTVGKNPIINVEETGNTDDPITRKVVKGGKEEEVTETPPPRTSTQEVRRLKQKYHAKKVDALFPGANPNLPEDFKAATEQGGSVVLPTESLAEFKLA